MVGVNQRIYLPIAPKPAATSTESTPSVSRTGLMSTLVAPTLDLSNFSILLTETQSSPSVQKCRNMVLQRPLIPSTSVTAELPVTVQDSSSAPPVLSLTKTTPPVHSSSKMVLQNQSPLSTVVTQTPSAPVIYSFGKMIPHIQSPAAVSQTPSTLAINNTGNVVSQSQLPLSTTATHSPSTPIPDPGNLLVQNQSALSAVVAQTPSTLATCRSNGMVPHIQSPLLAAVSQTLTAPGVNNTGPMVAQSRTPLSAIVSHTPPTPSIPGTDDMPGKNQSPLSAVVLQTPVPVSGNTLAQNQSPFLPVVSQVARKLAINSSGNIVRHDQSSLLVAGSQSSTLAVQSSGNMLILTQSPLVTAASRIHAAKSLCDSDNKVPQGQSSLSAVSQTSSTQAIRSIDNMAPQTRLQTRSPVIGLPDASSQTQNQLPVSIVTRSDLSHSDSMSTNSQPSSTIIPQIVPQSFISTCGISSNTSMPLLKNSGNVVRHGQSQALASWSTTHHHQGWPPRSDGRPDVSLEQPIYATPSQITSFDPALLTADRNNQQITYGPQATNQVMNVPTVNTRATSSFGRWVVSPGLDVLANVAQREQSADSITSSSHVQVYMDIKRDVFVFAVNC